MVCVECRDSRHSGCENLKRLGVAIPVTSQWCDCQHQPRDGELLNFLLMREPAR